MNVSLWFPTPLRPGDVLPVVGAHSSTRGFSWGTIPDPPAGLSVAVSLDDFAATSATGTARVLGVEFRPLLHRDDVVDRGLDDIVNMAFAIGGVSGSTSRLKLTARVTVETPLGAFPARNEARSASVEALIRPELLELAVDPDGPATVVAREFRGHDVFYRVLLDGVELVSQRPSNEIVPLGARVAIRLHSGRAPVVSCDMEPLVAQLGHHPHLFGGHGAFRVRGVLGVGRRPAAVARGTTSRAPAAAA